MARRLLARVGARLPDWRSTLVSAALFGTMLISAFAAWAVHDAWTEHRASVDASLDEYARYAARAFGEQLLHANDELRLRALAPVMGNPVPESGEAMALARFAALSGAVMDAAGLGGDPRGGVFRMNPRGGDYQGADEAATPALAAEIRGIIYERLVRRDWSGEPLVAMATARGEPVLVAFARQRTAAGGTAAIFGRTLSYDLAMRVLAAGTQRRLSLVPPSFVSTEWRVGRDAAGEDTVVAIQLLDRSGRELYRSPSASPPPCAGSSWCARSRWGSSFARQCTRISSSGSRRRTGTTSGGASRSRSRSSRSSWRRPRS